MLTQSKFSGLVAAIVLVGAGALHAQQSVKSGVYTDAQAERGKAAYAEKCAACHGDKLDGGGAPGLAGKDFLSFHAGEGLSDLFDKIKETMPASDPGSMTPAQTADMVAFILKTNQFPAGTKDLPSEVAALKTITFDK